jgi:hypothetical protein
VADIKQPLREQPLAVAGLALSGMPSAAPGMEPLFGQGEPYTVVAFNDAGRSKPYPQN